MKNLIVRVLSVFLIFNTTTIQPAVSQSFSVGTFVPRKIIRENTNLDNLASDQTYKNSFKEVLKNINSGYQPTIRSLVSPTVDKKRQKRFEKSLFEAAKLWSPYFKPENVTVVYIGPKDSKWADEVVKTEKLESMLYAPISELLKRNGNCNFAMAGKPNGNYTIITCLQSDDLIKLQDGPHEYTHFFQMSNNSIPDYAPCWITEGMAHFYGEAIGYSKNDKNRREGFKMYKSQTINFDRESNKNRNSGTLPKLMIKNSVEVTKNLYQGMESPGAGGKASGCYVLGGMAFEVLVSKYGHQKVAEFMLKFNTSKDWKNNFKSTFGIDELEFYSKMTPYISFMGKKIMNSPALGN